MSKYKYISVTEEEKEVIDSYISNKYDSVSRISHGAAISQLAKEAMKE